VSAVRDILAEDPAHPRFLHYTFEGEQGSFQIRLEFDTIESAREWRRDISGELRVRSAVVFCRAHFRGRASVPL
jgi:sterol 3beta-glucosyltransferase